MTLLHGTDTLADRMKKETMDNPVFVSINQKYSAYDSPLHVDKDDKQHEDKADKDDHRSKHAIGGVAKARLDYPHTDKLPSGDKHPQPSEDD